MTPTERTLAHYRRNGYRIERVERWVQAGRGGYRKDFLGIIDFLAVRHQTPVLGVQSCGLAWAEHVRKIEASRPLLDLWLSTGSGFDLVGWRKLKAGWTIRSHSYHESPLPPPLRGGKRAEPEKVSVKLTQMGLFDGLT